MLILFLTCSSCYEQGKNGTPWHVVMMWWILKASTRTNNNSLQIGCSIGARNLHMTKMVGIVVAANGGGSLLHHIAVLYALTGTPILRKAWTAASSCASCFLVALPSPFTAPLTEGHVSKAQNDMVNIHLLFTAILHSALLMCSASMLSACSKCILCKYIVR